jgi:Ring finger domain
MALIFMCCLMVLIIVKSRLRLQQQTEAFQRSQETDAERGGDGDAADEDIVAGKRQILEDRIKRRYETIDAWLVSKRVQHHDDVCDRIVRQYSVKTQHLRSTETSHHPGEEDSQNDSPDVECAICMGPMKAGEWAAWSANEECTHAFHRPCIGPWLLKRTDCPCCRNELLPIDKVRSLDQKFQAIHRLTQEHRQRSSLSYCCDCHGLVILRPDVACPASELQEIKQFVGTSRGSACSWEETDDASSRCYEGGSSPRLSDAENGEGHGRRQSQIIGRTESDDEAEIKPDESETNLEVESGNEC